MQRTAWIILALGAVGAALFWLGSPSPAEGEMGFADYVGEDGSIRLPQNFRTEFAHLGSWYVPEGEHSGFHDVYTQPSTVEAYRKTGAFPDGAVLVKEIRAGAAGNYTTGANVGYATDTIKQWFVMVKDAKGRFPDNPLWGDGWGWALYKPDDPSKNVATNYQSDCLGCHLPARDKDWVYTEAYPTLKR